MIRNDRRSTITEAARAFARKLDGMMLGWNYTYLSEGSHIDVTVLVNNVTTLYKHLPLAELLEQNIAIIAKNMGTGDVGVERESPKKKQFGEWTVQQSVPAELQLHLVRWGGTEWRTLLPKVMSKVPKDEKYHLVDGYYAGHGYKKGVFTFTKEDPPQIPGVDIPLWDKQYDVEPIIK